MFFDNSECAGLQWRAFFDKVDKEREEQSPSPGSEHGGKSVATLPFTKSICYGECPTQETQNLILIRCSLCKKLVKEVGYAYHLRNRHSHRSESPNASFSGDDIQDFLLSPPHLPMIASTSRNYKGMHSPPLSPHTYRTDTSDRIRSPPYYVEQRNDLVLRLTKRVPSMNLNDDEPQLEECEVYIGPEFQIPPDVKPKSNRGRKPKKKRGRIKSENSETTVKLETVTSYMGFETELEESPMKTPGKALSKPLRSRGRFKEEIHEKLPVSLCSPSTEFSNSSSVVCLDSPETPAVRANKSKSKSEAAKRSPIVESAKTETVTNSNRKPNRSLNFVENCPKEMKNEEIDLLQKLMRIPGLNVTVSPTKLVGERRFSTEMKVEEVQKEEQKPVDPAENKKIVLKKLQIVRNQMAQNVASRHGVSRLHESTNATKTPSPSESNSSEDSNSSSSIEGIELFDSKLEYDISLADSGSLRALLADPNRKKPVYRKITLPSSQASNIRPIVQVKVENADSSTEVGVQKLVKLTPFFRRGGMASAARLPRHLLGSCNSAQDFRKLLSETARAEMAQPLSLSSSVGIKRIRRQVLNQPLSSIRPPTSEQPSHPNISARILKGIKVSTTPTISSHNSPDPSSMDFKFPSIPVQTSENGSLSNASTSNQSNSNSNDIAAPASPTVSVPTYQPKIIPLSRCASPTSSGSITQPQTPQTIPLRRVSRESTPGYIEGVPISPRINGMIYQNIVPKHEEYTSSNGIDSDRSRYQPSALQRRINAELAEQLHQQRMMIRAAQASGQVPYSETSHEVLSLDHHGTPEVNQTTPPHLISHQDQRAYLKRQSDSIDFDDGQQMGYQNFKRMRMEPSKTASYEPSTYPGEACDYRPPCRRVVRATPRGQHRSMAQTFPVNISHDYAQGQEIQPQVYYDTNQCLEMGNQEYMDQGAYMEQQPFMHVQQQRTPMYRPGMHKRAAQGMVPAGSMVHMQGMEMVSTPSSSQAILISGPSSSQPQFVPIQPTNRRLTQVNHSQQQNLMYIQPKPVHMQQPVLLQINPMRHPQHQAFPVQSIEPPPVLQAEVCLPESPSHRAHPHNPYQYQQQHHYPPQRQQQLPTLLPRRQPHHHHHHQQQNNGFIGVPASFAAGMPPQPTHFQLVVAPPTQLQTPVLDLNSISNVSHTS